MKIFPSPPRKAEHQLQDTLLTAVVSLYLYMAKTAKLKGEELNFIDRILHSMFGNDIPLYKLEQARRQVLSFREAANYLNQHLSLSDRSKIILNLVTLAFHERKKLNILGSLEIVELTDLLRLDVSLLDSIYQLMEGQRDVIDLPALVSTNADSLLMNSMVWAAHGADYRFIGTDATSRFVFIMIESLVLFYPDGGRNNQLCRIIDSGEERELESKRFHRLRDDSIIILQGRVGELRISTKDLWYIYNLGSRTISISCPDTGVKLRYQAHKFHLVSKNKYIPGKELALDELPLPTCSGSVLQLLTREVANDTLINKTGDYYLCRDKQGVFVQAQPNSSALLHFYYADEELLVQNISDLVVYINRIPITRANPVSFIQNQDIISIGTANYLINRHWELIEIPIQVNELVVEEISHSFAGGKTALANIHFNIPKGTMMAIMGPSGSGKTTLLQVLLGELKASRSSIRIDGLDFASNLPFFQKHIGYVPQDDLLFPNLTVYENLYYRIKLALPNLKNKEEIRTRIENLLHNVGLFEQRHMIVGDVMNKKLSGGQRRRLNIALELILNPVVIILDEPTSGLSSKDSENIAEFLCDLKEQNKIILCTIHQPNATVFAAFDQVLLLDKGGRQVYFGDSKEVFTYFDDELVQSGKHNDFLVSKRDLKAPDYFYDVIETSDFHGNRLFPPDYWEQKFRSYSFRKAMEGSVEEQSADSTQAQSSHKQLHFSPRNLFLLTRRNFLNKLRSKINLTMTLLVAPLLALLTAFVLRGTTEGTPYSFLDNQNVLLFGFISVIIFIFIGLANSIDDILSEKRSIQREMKLNITAKCHLLSKQAVLLIMTLVQVLLYYFISAAVLGMRGYFLPQSIFLLLSGMVGYSMGLLFSSIIKDRSAIINILPLIIIPQIMFSGAVIRFAEMNKSLRINHKSEIPEFCQAVPSRWLFEGWTVASARLNLLEYEKKNFLKTVKNTSRGYEQYMIDVSAHNLFLDAHPDTRYGNELIRSSVKLAHGDYLNQSRNIFLSYKTMVWGKERDTIKLDIIVSLLMIGLFSLLTLLRLRYGFR
ncbi:MAG: ABC transporter ATP-binding protein [Candidatus Cloacimonetes bacterium]|nr:ABC transporter ATP-binding protein [Candidatus Cloacimonadota bacterium]